MPKDRAGAPRASGPRTPRVSPTSGHAPLPMRMEHFPTARTRRIAGRYRTWLFALVVLTIAAGPSYHFTRPRVRCGIPARDYQFAGLSPHLFALSQPALTLTSPASDAAPVQTLARLYQFDVGKLEIEHCSVSEMALQIFPDGYWRLDLRADQNPRQLKPLDVVPNVTTAQPATRYTADLRRNQFHVRVQCYAAAAGANGSRLGKPIVATLTPDPFWVQRGEPRSWSATGGDPELRTFFPTIDRVGVEFYYRKAPGRDSTVP